MKRFLNNLIYKFFRILIPKKNSNKYETEHFGTYYGGYDIIHTNDIELVISCGLGEDATFDIELLKKYNCKVIIIDPTPRAIKHYEEISSRFGRENDKNYEEKGGKQFANSYNLTNINKERLVFIDKAITDKNNSKIKLFFPKNKDFVSTSFEIDKNYSKEYLLAETINLENILKKFQLKKIDILKLDIEGGEIIVLNDLIKKKIFPNQILVEYKNIKNLNPFKLFKIFKINKKLLKNGYKIVNVNTKGDYTYLKIP